MLISCTNYGPNIYGGRHQKTGETKDKDFRGIDLGYGVTGRACLSYGRTLVYQYDVPYYWEPPTNLKSDVIQFKTADVANMYFLNDINAYYYYYNGNSLVKKVSIKSHELSDYNFNLETILVLKDIKSKGVN